MRSPPARELTSSCTTTNTPSCSPASTRRAGAGARGSTSRRADTLDALIEQGDASSPPKPASGARIIILTSGTTGTPKGAPRSEPKSLSLLGGLLSKVPFRARETTELCVPMFHALGFAQAVVGIGLGSTVVLRRRFDPVETLESIERHRPSVMVMVPVMLQRTVDKLDGARPPARHLLAADHLSVRFGSRR